jgi:hypothetical protein
MYSTIDNLYEPSEYIILRIGDIKLDKKDLFWGQKVIQISSTDLHLLTENCMFCLALGLLGSWAPRL